MAVRTRRTAPTKTTTSAHLPPPGTLRPTSPSLPPHPMNPVYRPVPRHPRQHIASMSATATSPPQLSSSTPLPLAILPLTPPIHPPPTPRPAPVLSPPDWHRPNPAHVPPAAVLLGTERIPPLYLSTHPANPGPSSRPALSSKVLPTAPRCSASPPTPCPTSPPTARAPSTTARSDIGARASILDPRVM